MAKERHVFISHWPVLSERRNQLSHALRKYDWDIQWVTQFDRRTLSPQIIEQYYTDDPALFHIRAALGGHFRIPLPYYSLRPSEIANAITHIYILQQIVARNIDVALILEDDVLLHDDFASLLDLYHSQLPPDWDLLYPGSGCNLHVARTSPGRYIYANPRRESRTADCYLITRKAAEKLLSTIVPFVLPIDWELSYHQEQHRLNVYWGEPSIARQGSEVGSYSSSVERIQ